MAKTGIKIVVGNSSFGSNPNVNANSILFVAGAVAVATGDIAFTLDTPFMLRSLSDLDAFDITEANNPKVYRQVKDFYAPKKGLNNNGTVLWLVGMTTITTTTVILSAVRATVLSGFEFRPRNILIAQLNVFAGAPLAVSAIQTAIDTLYEEGFTTVAIVGDCVRGDVASYTLPDLSTNEAPMVGVLVVSDIQSAEACVGKVGGFMASLSVGTSIGDGSLPAFADSMYMVDMTGVSTYVNTPCAKLTLAKAEEFGTKQYIFARTRPPYNGLWLNDGATAEDSTTALSSLEMGRTLASLVDDLRYFLTPYLNTKIPVNKDGDIDAAYKQALLNELRSKVIVPYITSGDISDANVTLAAKDNDMVSTRTWKVSLSVLPSPTLRWIDGYVFYVTSL